MIRKRLRNECKISPDDFTDDELLTIIGLFEMYGTSIVNKAKAFHVPPCYMKSDCTPNSYTILLSNYSLMCKASVDILKGQVITKCYGNVLECTYSRRTGIEDQCMFECNCKRCNDPTEFGTYFGGIYCSACNTFNPDGEQITMKGILSKENSSQQSSDWNCNHCDSTCSSEECQKTWKRLSDNIHEALANSQGSIQVLDLLLTSRGEWDRAYKNGQLMTECKRTFISTLGSDFSKFDEVKFEQKLQYCRDILALLDKFHPGCSYERVSTIYEAISVGSEFLKRWMDKNDKNEDFCKLKKDMKRWCEECLTVIKHEEPSSPYNGLRSWLDTIIAGL